MSLYGKKWSRARLLNDHQVWQAAQFWAAQRDTCQIATLLFVCESTVYNHLSLIRKSASTLPRMGEMI